MDTNTEYMLNGKMVTRQELRVAFIERQINELREEMEDELPSKQGNYSDAIWHSMLEVRALARQQVKLLEDWLEQEKRVADAPLPDEEIPGPIDFTNWPGFTPDEAQRQHAHDADIDSRGDEPYGERDE